MEYANADVSSNLVVNAEQSLLSTVAASNSAQMAAANLAANNHQYGSSAAASFINSYATSPHMAANNSWSRFVDSYGAHAYATPAAGDSVYGGAMGTSAVPSSIHEYYKRNNGIVGMGNGHHHTHHLMQSSSAPSMQLHQANVFADGHGESLAGISWATGTSAAAVGSSALLGAPNAAYAMIPSSESHLS